MLNAGCWILLAGLACLALPAAILLPSSFYCSDLQYDALQTSSEHGSASIRKRPTFIPAIELDLPFIHTPLALRGGLKGPSLRVELNAWYEYI